MRKICLLVVLFFTFIIFTGGCGASNEAQAAQADSVTETLPEQEQIEFWKSGMKRLGNVIDRSTPEKVAELWALAYRRDGLCAKNGALQYILFTEAYQNEKLEDFVALGWNSRGSSPWAEDYKILQKTVNEDGTVTITMELNWVTSDGGTVYQHTLHMTQNDGLWLIEKVDDGIW